MKQELTPEELELTTVVRDKWINLAFEGCKKGIDTEKFETGIEWLYQKFLNLPKPQVIYCDSLLAAGLMITLIKDYGKEPEDYTPEVLQNYRDGKMDKQFLDQLQENLKLKSSYIGWSNMGWVAFYDFFTQINVLDNEDFNNYQKLIESNVFECFEFDNVVFAVRPPIEVHYNETNVPHNVEGPSVLFQDGEKFYHINGFSTTPELFNKLYNREYTFEDFVKESNEEVKSAVLAYIQSRDGDTGVYYFLKQNLKEVDTFVDKKAEEFMEGTTRGMNIGVYTLFKGNVSDVDIAYVRCYCPSTDRMFFLGVEPEQRNAKDAIASLYTVPRLFKDKIVSISRQGEKFSTVFTEDVMTGLKNGTYSTEELQDYVSISGDEYFGKMRYEY